MLLRIARVISPGEPGVRVDVGIRVEGGMITELAPAAEFGSQVDNDGARSGRRWWRTVSASRARESPSSASASITVGHAAHLPMTQRGVWHAF